MPNVIPAFRRILPCAATKERKEVIDLTNGGLYFTAEHSTADRNALTPSLHLRQEQYREFHKKKKKDFFFFVAVRFFLCRLRWVNYLRKLGTEAEISVSFGRRHNRGIVGECFAVGREAVTSDVSLLLASHVGHQVADAVAVSELVVVPGWKKTDAESLVRTNGSACVSERNQTNAP